MHTTALAIALLGFALVNAQTPPVPGVTGQLGDAAITEGNPAGVTYTATLPDLDTTDIRGYISATASANGTGVVFTVNLYGFPSEDLGPFLYHIHDQPVPADGNCTKTLAHLDPYVRGEAPPCYAPQPQTCQVGDLSGKHGNITSPGLQTSYLDLYASTKEGLGSFLGNRSINVHTSNTTRLTCASFVLTSSTTNTTNNTISTNSTNTTVPSSPTLTPVTYKGGAATNFVTGTAVVGLFVAGLALFL